MNITPTIEGGLRVCPESETDWDVLSSISADIGRPAHLAESLAGLMGDASDDWEEFVVPDIKETFNSQQKFVHDSVQHAHDYNEGTIFITKREADRWYGALNQARISLQARYQLDEIDDPNDLEDAAPELRNAHFRSRFYSALQSLMIDYVMDED